MGGKPERVTSAEKERRLDGGGWEGRARWCLEWRAREESRRGAGGELERGPRGVREELERSQRGAREEPERSWQRAREEPERSQ